MTNESALAGLLDWWKAVPEARRPGQRARFSISEAEAELYTLGLRETWSSCGPGVLKLAETHREKLRSDALAAISDVLSWLDSIESSLESTCTRDDHHYRESHSWIARWRGKLQETAEDPLAEPFGSTLGPSPGSQLLASYRWWADGVETLQGPGGPLSDLPAFVAEACAEFQERPASRMGGLGALWSMAMITFPESVRQLQYAQACSPWTPAHLLNWLLSDQGVLRPLHNSPPFAGPPAVPHARPWLDQMDVAFRDWHGERCAGPVAAAYLQLACPVIPSAYIVAPGDGPLAIRDLNGRVLHGLTVAQGLASVFEFLLYRVAMLERRSSAPSERETRLPRLTIVDGDRRGRFALEVENRLDVRPVSKGAAALLFALGRDGERAHIPARDLMNLRHMVPEIAPVLETGKKVKNHYASCKSAALRGQVSWRASSPPPNA